MNAHHNLDPTRWIKASKSAGDNACVEMRRSGENVLVRDTKQDGRGATLDIRASALAAWITTAKNGKLDGLLS